MRKNLITQLFSTAEKIKIYGDYLTVRLKYLRQNMLESQNTGLKLETQNLLEYYFSHIVVSEDTCNYFLISISTIFSDINDYNYQDETDNILKTLTENYIAKDQITMQDIFLTLSQTITLLTSVLDHIPDNKIGDINQKLDQLIELELEQIKLMNDSLKLDEKAWLKGYLH